MIIDLRLQNDNDERDTAGLSLAKNEAYRAVPKIILTRFPTFEYVRDALGPSLNGLPPAVNFLAKQEGPKVMIEAVEKAFADHVPINWGLNILWGERLSNLQLLSLIDPEIESHRIPHRADELLDLFRHIFAESSQITVDRILTAQDQKVSLAIFAFSNDGGVSRYVITCGLLANVRQEDTSYGKYAPKTTREGHALKCATAETVHYAAIAYTLTGAVLEEISAFNDFYHKNSAETVIEALRYLFETTLAEWHRSGEYFENDKSFRDIFVASLPIDADLLRQASLEARLGGLKTQALAHNLPEFDHETWQFFFNLINGSVVLDTPPKYGLIHRQLRSDSILVDCHGKAWLVDFSQISRGAVVYDYVSIESIIRFDLLTMLNPLERLELEEYLSEGSRSTAEHFLGQAAPDVRKAVKVITFIRQQAAKVANQDMTPYWAGLVYKAIADLIDYTPEVFHTYPELVRYLHRFVSIGVLSRSLIKGGVQRDFLIDRHKKVVQVEGQTVSNLTRLQV